MKNRKTMKVIEHLEKGKDPLLNYEIIPLLRGKKVNEINGEY